MQHKFFKDSHQDQSMLLPPSFDELIDIDHPVRIVNDVIERVDLERIYEGYKGGGAPNYLPRMMLKVITWSYVNNEYSSRRIERLCKENVPCMWLAAMARPDHNTINTFRTHRLGKHLKSVFTEVVKMLVEAGVLSIDEVSYDGTKIEANANRYRVVWAKSVETNKKKLAAKIDALWEQAKAVASEELENKEPTQINQVSPEQVMETVTRINEALGGKTVSKPLAKAIKHANTELVQQAKRYKEQEEILAGRGSYSTTDPDATFMRNKDDHGEHGTPKPNYNVQISTSNQYVVNYSLHQTPGDTTTLIDHFNSFEKQYEVLPETILADAAYGSDENYSFTDAHNIEALIKYNIFDKERTKAWLVKNPFSQDSLYYNTEHDFYVCPMGQQMAKTDIKIDKTSTGFEQELHLYQAQNCNGCPLRGKCHNAAGNRIIAVNHRLQKYRQKARGLLLSEEGKQRYRKRSIDVESAFGDVKENKKFRRFSLRGLFKTEVEFGLISLGHNLKKYTLKIAKDRSKRNALAMC
jgi:transposase